MALGSGQRAGTISGFLWLLPSVDVFSVAFCMMLLSTLALKVRLIKNGGDLKSCMKTVVGTRKVNAWRRADMKLEVN
jgi:hypothetical protein